MNSNQFNQYGHQPNFNQNCGSPNNLIYAPPHPPVHVHVVPANNNRMATICNVCGMPT